jgi:hypothetical protein
MKAGKLNSDWSPSMFIKSSEAKQCLFLSRTEPIGSLRVPNEKLTTNPYEKLEILDLFMDLRRDGDARFSL